MHQNKGTILKNNKISDNIFEMIISCKEIAEASQPGQFLHVKVSDGQEPILRRPISINRVDKAAGTICLVYHVVGKGTELLSQMEAAKLIDIMGPIGNGFPLFTDKKCAVVGGGIGTAPLLELAANLTACDAFLGFRDNTILVDQFTACCNQVNIATEDGSVGHKGYVTDLLSDKIKAYDVVYTCGPKIMMAKVKKICQDAGVRCYVSVEERMGCGVGACLVCACKTNGKNGEWHYKKACVDGPVFEAGEVELND